MKLKELFKYVESQNKMSEFMNNNLGYKEVHIVKIDGYTFKEDEFKKVKELVKVINEEFYTNIDENIELVNNNGYIEMTFEQSIPDYINGKFDYRKENKTITLYLDVKQVWN